MNRRKFLMLSGSGASGILLANTSLLTGSGSGSKRDLVFVGTYTEAPEQGILRYRFDPSSGKLMPSGLAIPAVNPSFLARSYDGRFLFAVNETADYKGIPGGYVSSYRILNDQGDLRFLGSQPTRGAHPCHVAVSADNRFLLVSNYTGGNVSVIPVAADGSLKESVCEIRHEGSGPNKERQEKAHVHSVTLSADNRFACVCDLGLDQVVVYPFNKESGILDAAGKIIYHTAPGAGPRHFCFTGDGKLALLINELDSTLSLLSFDRNTGQLKEVTTQPTLPSEFTGQNTCADVHVHPSGRFVYGSNRGHDSIVLFALNREDRTLSQRAHFPTGGNTPRNFAIDPLGNFLMAANQNSGSIKVLRINPESGHLMPLDTVSGINKPVCINF